VWCAQRSRGGVGTGAIGDLEVVPTEVEEVPWITGDDDRSSSAYDRLLAGVLGGWNSGGRPGSQGPTHSAQRTFLRRAGAEGKWILPGRSGTAESHD
jgi:hypothetical protein